MVSGVMKLGKVEIRDFRNHRHSLIECAGGINALFGDNGEGKTNIVEAISYLCLAKSFYASNDSVVLKIGCERFEVTGEFQGDNETTWTVKALYENATTKKTLTVNKVAAETLSSFVGQFPAVVLSPEQNGITFGAPTERRRFLDLAISQASKMYLEKLLEYRKILRQRNKILFDAKVGRHDPSGELEPWDESLVLTGTDIMMRRRAFVGEFMPAMMEQFRRVAGGTEEPGIAYQPSFAIEAGTDREAVEKRFREELRAHNGEERKAGTTITGPHRDELDFGIDGMSLRKFASQGQHKTFLVALKLAEFFYLKEKREETPILLLDDVFSELDKGRSARLLDFAEGLGQVFVTATDDGAFPPGFPWNGKHRRFTVKQGTTEEHAEKRLFVN